MQVIDMPGRPPIGKPDLERLRVRFIKNDRLAYLGHLEVINTISRSVRRAKMPFSVGNGFAQRMRIQFSQALPVGAASTCEYYDLYLTERVNEGEAFELLRASTPKAMAPTEAHFVKSKLPALEAWLTRSDWDIRLFGRDFDASALGLALEDLKGIGKIDFMRGDKPRSIGLDSTLVSWALEDCEKEGEWDCVHMTLKTRSSNLGALRPAVLLEAAFKTPVLAGAMLDSTRVLRQGQWNEAEDGSLIDPFDPGLLL